MTYTVLIPDNVDPKAIDLLQSTDGITVNAPGKIARDDLLQIVGDAHAMIIRSGVKADAELLAAASNLKAIARAGVGVDNIDLAAATEHGIIVMNTPAGNTIATAELTFGLMLALARHIPQSNNSLKAGKWDRKQYVGTELRGKTLGVIGFGRVGRAVAVRARAFEMNVVAYDPFIPQDVAIDLGASLVDMDTLFAQADFITLHALITDETHGLINAANIAKMKDGVRIINAARGPLINDHDLAEALKSGKVAGAAVDVYEEEPPPADHPLIGLDNVIDTPHLGASTDDAQVAVAVEAAELIIETLLKNNPQNVVNHDVL